MNRFPLLLLFVMFLVSSCSNTDFDYSSLHAYFVFDNGQHQDATLQSALNPLSPGVFCRVSEGQEGAVTYFYFESNEGLSTKQKANADDMRRTRAIGLYNKTGIIACHPLCFRLAVSQLLRRDQHAQQQAFIHVERHSVVQPMQAPVQPQQQRIVYQCGRQETD